MIRVILVPFFYLAQKKRKIMWRQSGVGRGIENEKEGGGVGEMWIFWRERRMWEQTPPEKQKTQTQERKRGSSGFKTTVLTLNQPHSGMFWALMFFMDYRLFQTLNKDSPRKASFPSCPCFSYSSPNSLPLVVSCRVRADLPGAGLKACLVHCKFWRLPLWYLHSGRRTQRRIWAEAYDGAGLQLCIFQAPTSLCTRANPTHQHTIPRRAGVRGRLTYRTEAKAGGAPTNATFGNSVDDLIPL